MDNVRFVNNITKEYPDMYKILIYKEPRVFINKETRKRKREEVCDSEYIPKISSINRTKTLIKDIIICNDFELFCTFTFDPKKVDSFNFGLVYGKMSRWIHNQYNRSREQGVDFKYLIVPEMHKSGRWHFHALISGFVGTLKPSKCATQSGRLVYNITSFHGGFTTAVKIDSKDGVASYVSKYITKEFIQYFNQRRFFCSRGLVRPTKQINSHVFSNTPPLFRRLVSHNYNSFDFIIDK